jgi:hypothetical protein
MMLRYIGQTDPMKKVCVLLDKVSGYVVILT